jgi:hypothetical protein
MSCQQYSEDNIISVFVAESIKETEETNKETEETNRETSETSETKEGGVVGERSSPQECPICMDDIDLKNNCIVTECGHIFHCSCLMKNAATNGFGCPMCRSVMAEQLADDDSDEYTSEYDEYEYEEDMFDDNALTSFRMFQQQLEGEEVEEEEVEEVDANAVDDEYEPIIVMPNSETIATKLIARGFTMEDAVKVLLLEHGEYSDFEDVYNRRAQEIYGEIRRMIHIALSQ